MSEALAILARKASAMYSTRERLVSLRLLGMAKAFDQQLGSTAFSAMSFEERLSHLVSIGVQTGPPIGAQKGPPFKMAQG